MADKPKWPDVRAFVDGSVYVFDFGECHGEVVIDVYRDGELVDTVKAGKVSDGG